MKQPTEDMFQKLSAALKERDEALHRVASKCQRGRIAEIIELLKDQRAEACCEGEKVAAAYWYRFGPFAVSVNWYPFRLWRKWRWRREIPPATPAAVPFWAGPWL